MILVFIVRAVVCECLREEKYSADFQNPDAVFAGLFQFYLLTETGLSCTKYK